MNLKWIDNAIASYSAVLDQDEQARLAFFRGLWALQEEAAKELPADLYECPGKEHLQACLAEGKTFLADASFAVDTEKFIAHSQRIAAYLLENGSLNEEITTAFTGMSWDVLIETSDVAAAGVKPFDYLDSTGVVLMDMDYTENQTRMILLVLSAALRIQLETVAKAARGALGPKGFEEEHPRTCPVCGSEASLAHVGGSTSSSGRGKLLFCTQCGMTWEFDRVRCARCGTTSQGKLHYYNIEGDDDHRIGTCDECGGYIRTLYSDNDLRPVSYEVEDVVMAKLDAIALTFAKNGNE